MYQEILIILKDMLFESCVDIGEINSLISFYEKLNFEELDENLYQTLQSAIQKNLTFLTH